MDKLKLNPKHRRNKRPHLFKAEELIFYKTKANVKLTKTLYNYCLDAKSYERKVGKSAFI